MTHLNYSGPPTATHVKSFEIVLQIMTTHTRVDGNIISLHGGCTTGFMDLQRRHKRIHGLRD